MGEGCISVAGGYIWSRCVSNPGLVDALGRAAQLITNRKGIIISGITHRFYQISKISVILLQHIHFLFQCTFSQFFSLPFKFPKREQSRYSIPPRAHTINLGRMTTQKKIFPHPWPRSETWSYRAYRATQTPLFLNPLMLLPFDTQVCHERQICLRFHWILKVNLSAHCTSIWKLNRISRTSNNKIAQKCIWCCSRVQWCVTDLAGGVKLYSGAWNRGQDSHTGVFSLCIPSLRASSLLTTCWGLHDNNIRFQTWQQ